MSSPISAYALTSAGWIFDTAASVLAVALAALLCALVAGGWLAASSPAFPLLTVCCLGLVTLVAFPNRMNPGAASPRRAESTGARQRWAFAAIPLAAAALSRTRHVPAGCSGLPRVVRWLALTAGACFAVYFIGSVLEMSTALKLWPLGGGIERALALTDMLIAGTLADRARYSCNYASVASARARLSQPIPDTRSTARSASRT